MAELTYFSRPNFADSATHYTDIVVARQVGKFCAGQVPAGKLDVE